MKARSVLIIAITISLVSCKKSFYKAEDFDTRTFAHKTIAVLPFEIQTRGFDSERLSAEEILSIKEEESRIFQASFHNQVLSSTDRGKNPIRVDLQHYTKTLSKLKEHDISVFDSWGESPEYLAEVLGVDAVVRGRIEKNKYFSDEVSAGIEITRDILGRSGRPIGYVNNKNKDVRTDFSLVDSEGGTVLWAIDYKYKTDWEGSTNALVDKINKKSVSHFPYRIRS